MHQQTATVTPIPETQAARTFLDDLNDTLAAGKFVDLASDKPVDEIDEVVIGELNDYERALYTLMHSYGQTQKAFINKNFDAFREFVGDTKDLPAIHRQLDSMKEHHDAAAALLWASVKDRYNRERASAADSTGLGIRQGFQVVLMLGEEPCSGLGSILARVLSGDRFS